MKFKSNFKVIAPAVLSDLNCGLDVFGWALDGLYDEVLVKPHNKPGIHIAEVIGNKTNIPIHYQNNAAGEAAHATLLHLQEAHGLSQGMGLELTLRKRVPVGYGLGSSAASAVAGAMAVNESFGRLLSKRDLLPFALKGEEVAEGKRRLNAVIPALLGGSFLIQDNAAARFYRLPFVRGLRLVLIYPRQIRLLQQERRALLPEQLPTSAVAQQAASSAALVHALYMSDLAAIRSALATWPFEPYLAEAIPQFQALKTAALERDALACGLAGKGSGVFALCKNSLDAEKIGQAFGEVYEAARIRHEIIHCGLDLEGAMVA